MIKFTTTYMNCFLSELYELICYFVNHKEFDIYKINIIELYNATKLVVVFNELNDYVVENLIDKWQDFNYGNWYIDEHFIDAGEII